ncbi:NIF3-like protein 1 isoform X2 [Bicyclus anynana]|uniref:NIF3-like protein 1 n=1 Tax=Bicyclus anynana TaxID=110368 RepID=A0A6J1P088_BICAN|nr:NIF3-like protein 1 isoform X2 [Bicyclus anynana]XP_023950542.1 NIF3-like protein 1 isoform X2 [Bicyclus anynana]XP_023950543.1 NIF3-like protein 1 isoform X2 [Bicyclus anynana]XP_052737530.1 NIF3-like protein 1 isoform X2 [Bicyclus anynana]XP_052737531.1 NIF3-like protein 1 isoform X2 [Bicyclus anynana]XP_052737532.1 NIF3-like protein 1 isoform X2 [Bicyclus anynana]
MFIKIGKSFLVKSNYRAYTKIMSKMSSGENMGIKLTEVVAALEKFAPKHLSEQWDNTGLLVEPYTPRNITKILLTNDLTEDVALEAKEKSCEMIISYHPPIFAPLKSIIQSAWKERIVSLLLETRIYLYSPHTSWDSVKGGVNDWLASAFPFDNSVPIIPGEDTETGAGRFLSITDNTDFKIHQAVESVKNLTGLKHVRLALAKGKTTNDKVRSVALCAGSGGSVLKKAANVDLFLTGEMLHHDILDATQRGITVILTNHSDSERGFLQGFSTHLRRELENQVDVIVSKCDKDPLLTV